MFRVLTVAREYGSGGGRIAGKIAERLGWELLDKALINEVARACRVDPELAGQYDERVDSWLHRVSRHGLWQGAFDGVASAVGKDILDAETVAALSRHLIEEAYNRGQCVIVGRGGQCILQDCDSAFHVFIYAPRQDRVRRVRERQPDSADIEDCIRWADQQRAEFIRLHFGCDWSAPHLYHMLVSSELGEDETASLIIEAMRLGPTQ